MSKASAKPKCLRPGCGKEICSRGLCKSCYGGARNVVRTKRATWEALEKSGKVLKARHTGVVIGWLLGNGGE